MVLAALLSFDYLSDNIVYCEGLFLSNNVCRTAGDTCIESYVACISAHNLNDVASCMALTGVAQTVNHLDNRVLGRVVTDRVFGCRDIVIDRAGNADTRNTCTG